MARVQVQLSPYDPAHLCPKCGSEGARPSYHVVPILAVFGRAPDLPCSGREMQGALGEHMCSKCEVCGFGWMTEVPGMDEHSVE